jgi:hypothetical protein
MNSIVTWGEISKGEISENWAGIDQLRMLRCQFASRYRLQGEIGKSEFLIFLFYFIFFFLPISPANDTRWQIGNAASATGLCRRR